MVLIGNITKACFVILLITCVVPVEAKKPNIMIILADDVGFGDVPYYRDGDGFNPDVVPELPHLKQFISEGTAFMDVHSTPLCAPSRYVLLSGNYNHRGQRLSGVWSLNYKQNQFRIGQRSIAEVLRDNGYDTSMFGKYHIGGKIPIKKGTVPTQFPERTTLLSSEHHDWTRQMKRGPLDIGFNYSYITTAGIQSPPYIFFKNNKIERNDLSNFSYWEKGSYAMPRGESIIQFEGEGAKDWDSTAYNMILVNETEQFLERHINEHEDKPFFSYVALGSVHEPHSPPDKYLDGTSVAGEYDTKHKDMLFEMDKVVGSLIKILEEKQLIDDTIIVFASDNGGKGSKFSDFSSGNLRESKGSIYEGGHRIPMILRWDKGNIPKGQSRSHLVGLNDLYATLCDLAGVDIPAGQAMDSVSFADYALDETKTQGLREYLGVWRIQWKKIVAQSIRQNEMKLIHHYQNDIFELYNLTADISEENDLSGDFPALVNDMFAQLKGISPCYDKRGKFDVYIPWEQQKVKKRCLWFRQKAKRCKMFQEGRLNCRFTCLSSESDKQMCNVNQS